MAVIRFPKVPPFNDLTEPQINICDHMTAVKNGKLFRIKDLNETNTCKGVFFDSISKQIFLIESRITSSLISIFSESGELLDRIKTAFVTDPFGIAVDGDNIYFTDIAMHCVFHFKMLPYFHHVATIGRKGTGYEEFNYPLRLAVSIHGDHGVFVADCMNDRIKIIDPLTPLKFLKFQNHISHCSMVAPCDVKLTPVSVYVLSLEDSLCVHVFSYTREKIRSLITGGCIGKQVVYPFCFCIDAEENLIICDSSTHQVKVFSKEGTLLLKIGKRGDGVGELRYPTGITLINNREIAVASWNVNYYLQLFCYS